MFPILEEFDEIKLTALMSIVVMLLLPEKVVAAGETTVTVPDVVNVPLPGVTVYDPPGSAVTAPIVLEPVGSAV